MNEAPSDRIRSAFQSLSLMLDECGYRMSYHRLLETRPASHPCWIWAHWDKYADGANRWGAEDQTRMVIKLEDYSVSFTCEFRRPITGLAKINSAYHSLGMSVNDIPSWTPTNLREIEGYFAQWGSFLCGTPVTFHADDANSTWQGPR